jgi:uncharacterized protein YqgV (UPF0045/DUF77 family)
VILEIQCLPSPIGVEDDPYRHVDAAIAVIEASGLHYEVGALGTTIEGPADELWALARRVHEACLSSGAASVVSVVKVVETAVTTDAATMDSLTAKFRR